MSEERVEMPITLSPDEVQELHDLAREVPGILRSAASAMRFFWDVAGAADSFGEDADGAYLLCVKGIEAYA